ncbi:uroporphyrinogen-III synthase [Flavobacterium urocaniciphilum]|uniref:Uroporphyrinogen-III synthase n=1 Tax=Flavobacterium urocaniciphilum TaxID=1299341 RepID=A0A1H9DSM4_9FLAO|nr:uroporphyrinogen-III synthase [Flavobacterium urocaniciphilum]SEQ15698.1 uroporphyrinogen-III synthase [Flavobacterium urocaniciphilum]
MSEKTTILSTKTLTSIQKQELVNAHFSVIEADFIKTENISFDLKKINDNLIFTSQNAVLSILNHPNIEDLKKKTVFCVGSKTKELLNENGFKVEAHTGYAEDLAEIISLVYADESYTFFSGNLRKDTLPNILTENGITFNEIKVYETSLTSQKIKETVDAILFFSPSGVTSYLKNNAITNEILFCIGTTTAASLEEKLPENKIKNIQVAYQPTIEHVIEEVIEYYS